MFPGQGSQWAGMGAELLDASPVFAARLAECAAALAPFVDWSLLDVLRGERARCDRVDVVQPVLFAVMVSLAALWRSPASSRPRWSATRRARSPPPCVAGALSLEDGARVVALRSQAIARRWPAAAAWCRSRCPRPRSRADRPWAAGLSVAAVNGPAAVVVSGDADALRGAGAAS